MAAPKSDRRFTADDIISQPLGRHLRIVACAGSGKTRALTGRVIRLIEEGVNPQSIVAFTFTNKAAAELRERIFNHFEAKLTADQVTARLQGMFLGTIHSFCLEFLQRYAGKYNSYSLLDENQEAAFLLRHERDLGLADLCLKAVKRDKPDFSKAYVTKSRAVATFKKSLSVFYNDMLKTKDVAKDPISQQFTQAVERYEKLLDASRLLSFDCLISRAVTEFAQHRDQIDDFKNRLLFLFVDEFQDINPAQEALVFSMISPRTEVFVVGDDDQSIYRWRGTTVDGIRDFKDRIKKYSKLPVTGIELTENHRSEHPIVVMAEKVVAKLGVERLAKQMTPALPQPKTPALFALEFESDRDEAEWIADQIDYLVDKQKVPLNEIAVLLRSVRTSGAVVREALDRRKRKSVVGGKMRFFDADIASFLKKFVAFLAGQDEWWENKHKKSSAVKITPAYLSSLLSPISGLTETAAKKAIAGAEKLYTDSKELKRFDLSSFYHQLLVTLHLSEHSDLIKADTEALVSLGCFNELLTDFEHTYRRSVQLDEVDDLGLPPSQVPEEKVTAATRKTVRSRSERMIVGLYWYIRQYAEDNYAEKTPDDEAETDAVRVMTIHQSKGLEFGYVFLPCLTNSRFPKAPSEKGEKKPWLVPLECFGVDRYEGTEADMRRLFYVALTRGKHAVFLSRFRKKAKEEGRSNNQPPSVFYEETLQHDGTKKISPTETKVLPLRVTRHTELRPELSVSEIIDFMTCPHLYEMRYRFGFQPPLAPELGYGKAIHHLLFRLSESLKTRSPLTDDHLTKLVNDEFYLPLANHAAFEKLKNSALRHIKNFQTFFCASKCETLEAEKSFTYLAPEVVIKGKIDLLEVVDGGKKVVNIRDFKTSIKSDDEDGTLQLQLYAIASKAEGLLPAKAVLHALDEQPDGEVERLVPIDASSLQATRERVRDAAGDIQAKRFKAKPAKDTCGACDYSLICRHACVTSKKAA